MGRSWPCRSGGARELAPPAERRRSSAATQSLNIAIAVEPLFTVTERDLEAPVEGVQVTL